MLRSSKTPTPVQWPVQLAPAASIDQPLADGGPWIVATNSVPKARVSADVAAVLRAVDGERNPAQVAHLLGLPWTAADVMGIVRQLAHTGIFDGGTNQPRDRRVQFRAPLTVQFTLFNPVPLLLRFRPVIAAFARPIVALPLALLLIGGMLGALTAGPSIWRVLATPLPLEVYLYVALAMFASTLLHEFGHGMALSYFGGTPRRIGIMLFYLSPAFFCDVTDGWRLSSRKQRVVIALAGPLVHLGLGSIALAVQTLLPASSVKDAALLYGVICWAVAILNLFPFIKLDGYVALMSAVDIPHLRQKSVKALADVVGFRILGARATFRGNGLLPWFGLASFIAGVGFMIIGFQRIVPIFLQLGYSGHIVVFAILCLLIVVAFRSVVQFFRAAAKNGSPLWRRALATLVGSLAIGALLAVIPVSPVTVAGYTYINGQLLIVTPNGASDGALEPGDSVTLQSQGMVIHENLGRATIGEHPPSLSTAPVDTIVPIALAGTALPVLAYVGQVEESTSLPASGRAEVTSRSQTTLGEWLWKAISHSPLWPGQPERDDSTRGHS
ncbi:daptide biosynthesis intramembrane metalloprotease [Paenarthrobacter sp. 2TAF44]|uniref:daptide biosynthesis intramembrane metalloprotease n=1 Tax=Paenarthrobacter sp. 2TAF44 TaxID=3233018 RepID=UPI003F99F4CB